MSALADLNRVMIEGVVTHIFLGKRAAGDDRGERGAPDAFVLASSNGRRTCYVMVKSFWEGTAGIRVDTRVRVTGTLQSYKAEHEEKASISIMASMIEVPGRPEGRETDAGADRRRGGPPSDADRPRGRVPPARANRDDREDYRGDDDGDSGHYRR